MRLRLFLVLLCATILRTAGQPSDTLRQEPRLTVDLQLLGHGEMRTGGLPEGAVDDHSRFVMNRERLVVGYQRDWIQAKVSLQHSNVWGEAGNATKTYEAWVRLQSPQGLFAQVGRQALSYDDERIIGPNDWAMASQSHDALSLGYEGKGHKAHAVLAYNQNGVNIDQGGTYFTGGAQPYKSMQLLWYHYDLPKLPLGASLLFMNVGMQAGLPQDDEHTENQQLLGAYVKYHPKGVTLDASYYRQMGHDEHGLEIDAWLAAAKAQWQLSRSIGLEAGFDYMSGDKNFNVPAKGILGLTRHEKICGFNPIYGSHHKFYGAMDFFYVSAYYGGFTPGLQNAYVGGTYSPLRQLSLTARYHYLATATKLEEMNMTLGHEIELAARYALARDMTIAAGYSYMTGTSTMERLKRASDDGRLRWAWVSIVFAPRLFTK